MSDADGGFPLMVWASSVTEVPPARSSLSWTLKSCRQWPGLNASLPTIASSITTMSTASAASARPGRETGFFGGATSPLSLVRPGHCRLRLRWPRIPRLDAALGPPVIRGGRWAAVGALISGVSRRVVDGVRRRFLRVVLGALVGSLVLGGFLVDSLVIGGLMIRGLGVGGRGVDVVVALVVIGGII